MGGVIVLGRIETSCCSSASVASGANIPQFRLKLMFQMLLTIYDSSCIMGEVKEGKKRAL